MLTPLIRSHTRSQVIHIHQYRIVCLCMDCCTLLPHVPLLIRPYCKLVHMYLTALIHWEV